MAPAPEFGFGVDPSFWEAESSDVEVEVEVEVEGASVGIDQGEPGAGEETVVQYPAQASLISEQNEPLPATLEEVEVSLPAPSQALQPSPPGLSPEARLRSAPDSPSRRELQVLLASASSGGGGRSGAGSGQAPREGERDEEDPEELHQVGEMDAQATANVLRALDSQMHPTPLGAAQRHEPWQEDAPLESDANEEEDSNRDETEQIGQSIGQVQDSEPRSPPQLLHTPGFNRLLRVSVQGSGQPGLVGASTLIGLTRGSDGIFRPTIQVGNPGTDEQERGARRTDPEGMAEVAAAQPLVEVAAVVSHPVDGEGRDGESTEPGAVGPPGSPAPSDGVGSHPVDGPHVEISVDPTVVHSHPIGPRLSNSSGRRVPLSARFQEEVTSTSERDEDHVVMRRWGLAAHAHDHRPPSSPPREAARRHVPEGHGPRSTPSDDQRRVWNEHPIGPSPLEGWARARADRLRQPTPYLPAHVADGSMPSAAREGADDARGCGPFRVYSPRMSRLVQDIHGRVWVWPSSAGQDASSVPDFDLSNGPQGVEELGGAGPAQPWRQSGRRGPDEWKDVWEEPRESGPSLELASPGGSAPPGWNTRQDVLLSTQSEPGEEEQQSAPAARSAEEGCSSNAAMMRDLEQSLDVVRRRRPVGTGAEEGCSSNGGIMQNLEQSLEGVRRAVGTEMQAMMFKEEAKRRSLERVSQDNLERLKAALVANARMEEQVQRAEAAQGEAERAAARAEAEAEGLRRQLAELEGREAALLALPVPHLERLQAEVRAVEGRVSAALVRARTAEEVQQARICSICFTSPRTRVFVQCGHTACDACTQGLKETTNMCHQCRSVIISTLQLYDN